MFRALAFILLLLIPAQAWAGPEQALTALVRDYEAWNIADDPLTAGQNGDRSALTLLPDVTPDADARRKAQLTAFQQQLAAIDPAQLSDDGRLNHAFLTRLVGDRLQSLAFDEARLAFSSDSGFHSVLPYLASVTAIDSAEDAEAWLARLDALPNYYADNIANARRGLATGFVQPRSTTEAALSQARRAVATPIADDPLLVPFKTRHAAYRARAETLLRERVRPAQAAFVAFLESEYLPNARKGLGVGGVPGGPEYYAWLARRFTTTDQTPAQIHQTGLSEVARIRAGMEAAKAEAGFAGTLPQFLAFLRSDPRFYAASRQDLLEKASEIAKRIDDQLPRWFATLPRLTYGVRPVPANIEDAYTTGRYFPGSPRLGLAGGYMVNTSRLDQRPLYELPALTLHEAVPGHHLQIALSQELADVPSFRRDADMSAFTEGWGLYAETLGGEMGIYRDPYERFGRLSYEMWRACRLVADTGLHAMGWTLDQARACFTDNTALSAHNIETELARYVSWPGQALAYKTGEMKILSLRAKAKAALGERFDIRRFHDAVLLAGPLPLDLLETRIDQWIAGELAPDATRPIGRSTP